ncbi:hypothetical protein EDD16DRAFT_1482978 [Pisolithus croceorrhizus]|nr:hypothetical protein EDD16DRAFT_1482978 [Pisolithus croceorrhizus]KAI6135598.1 hypothetical protein EV401DRAFT_1896946 [Pisolithus croceorrhizus]KAI6156119.1 hypothetical protein EDD17DRAFT_1489801 [Pisolithus thermaeus]
MVWLCSCWSGDTHLSFHTSPGRFLAANELKTMLAHTLISYDVKFEDHRRDGLSSGPVRTARVPSITTWYHWSFR